MPIGDYTGMIFGSVNTGKIFSFIGTIAMWFAAGAVGLLFLRWYLHRDKYNFFVDIWKVQKGVVIPQMERNIKGGYFIDKGVRDFRLLPNKYKDAVCRINARHIIKDGKKYRVFLRQEGDRYFYSFIPKVWKNTKSEDNFHLEVEDASIVNQAIIKDRLLRERHKEADKWEKYLQFIVPVVALIVLLVVMYYTYQWATEALGMVNTMTAKCGASVGW